MLKKFAGIVMGAIMTASVCAGAVAVAAVNRPVAQTEGDADPAAVPAAAAEVPTEYAAYLFAHFVGEEANASEEQMYFSVSTDGSTWYTLNASRPVLTVSKNNPEGSTGGVRDPSLIRLHDGSGFVVLATDLSIYDLGLQYGNNKWGMSQEHGSRNIIIWRSKGESLTEWDGPFAYEIAAPNATCLWAPEAIWDKEQNAYMVFWSSRTQDNGTQKVYRCYTTDFENFTEPEVYIECDESRIDTTIVEDNDVYYRFTKKENTSKVYMEKSDSLSGNFKLVSSFRVDRRTYWNEDGNFEGPTLYKLNDGTGYNLLLDQWDYKPFTTTNLAEGNFTSATAFDFGGLRFRHGSCIPITQTEYNALMGKWDLKTGDQTETGELVYHLNFEENLNAETDGTQKTAATSTGTINYDTGYQGTGKAVKINGQGNYLSLDPTLVKGLKSFTISFEAKADSLAWTFFIAPNDNPVLWHANNQYENQYYIGGPLHVDSTEGRFKAERYNGIPRPSTVAEQNGLGTDWHHYVIVYHQYSTKLFIDGKLVSTAVSAWLPTEILGETPAVFYIGRSNWGENHEFSGNLCMDDFRVYNYVLSDVNAVKLYTDLGLTAE